MKIAAPKGKRKHPAELQRPAALGPAGVAHDVNNLLTSVLGDCGFLLRQVRRDNRLRTMVEGVMNAAEFAALLARQLVASSGTGIRSAQPVEVGEVLTKMTGTLREVLGSKISLKIRAQPDAGAIHADPGNLTRLILNLAFNARDAMPEGGTLILAAARAESGGKRSREPRPAGPASYVLLTASDTGCGIDDATKARLFEPSFTTKAATGPGSRGMGLATIQEVVRAAGGFIEVASRRGRGTTFRIYFPRLPSPSRGTPLEQHAAVPRDTWRATILVVEDNQSVRRAVCRTLETCGHLVLACGSSSQALEIARRTPSPIHLLLTDAQLPGANGLVLARRLRTLRPETKVLLTSGYRYRGNSGRGAVAGFLLKPFSPYTLAKKVSEVLAGTKE